MDNYPPSAHLRIDCKKREGLRIVSKCEPSKQQGMSPALVCTFYLQLRWEASLPWRSTWTSWSKWTWWTSPTRRPWTFSWTQAQGQTRGPWRLQYQVSQPVSEFLKNTHHVNCVMRCYTWNHVIMSHFSKMQSTWHLDFPRLTFRYNQTGLYSFCNEEVSVFGWNNENLNKLTTEIVQETLDKSQSCLWHYSETTAQRGCLYGRMSLASWLA